MLDRLTPENLVYLAAVAAVQFASGQSAACIQLLSAFFEVLGDDLALLALDPPSTGEE